MGCLTRKNTQECRAHFVDFFHFLLLFVTFFTACNFHIPGIEILFFPEQVHLAMQLLHFMLSQPLEKINEQQKHFLEDLVLYICKGYTPLSTCKNVWQALEVRVTPMASCLISFSVFSYGRSVANHCQENHGSSCFV